MLKGKYNYTSTIDFTDLSNAEIIKSPDDLYSVVKIGDERKIMFNHNIIDRKTVIDRIEADLKTLNYILEDLNEDCSDTN